MSGREISFGPFRFDPAGGQLWRGQTKIRIGSRAAAILGALLETPGKLVSRSELYKRAWPDRTIGEGNLSVQIYGLRKALTGHGDLICAEASLGYRFVGDVRRESRPDNERRQCRYGRSYTDDRPIGRDLAIEGIARILGNNRLVTILGPGGIGKTTVALAVANHLHEAYSGGICFVDLSVISDENRVYAALTGALDLPIQMAASIEQVMLALHGRRLLLILDSCEHVIETVALLVERVLTEARDISILATSRESLRVGSEVIWRLDPLEIPPASVRATPVNILEYSSVRMFIRYARLDDDISATMADTIAEICRRLDGMPLAIELAASMVEVLGIEEVRRGLDERFSLLRMDRETAIPRQRSLAATIDWSYGLLLENERTVLRRLSVFVRSFTLEAAIAVASDEVVDAITVREAVVALANKS
ncbi:winged helix-turn-helix domain-containing protein, partial [Bradyrhizobium sp.]|uniref:winged helix-turn-helix domain-containing protein n=1 Tax=Bradyrhizobium sp. TaxID=376 RepID=UPI003C40BCF1